MRLRDTTYALPNWRVATDEVAAWTQSKPGFIADKIGIKERRYLGPGQTVSDLCAQATDSLFARNPQLRKEDVDLLVLVTQNPDHRLPHTSALLQGRLELPNRCACFDLSLGCSGWVYALTVLKGLMSLEGFKQALLLTCDPYSRIMARGDRSTVSVFGDAATASWFSADQGARIGRADYGTDGARGESLIVKAGGSAAPAWSLLNAERVDYPDEDLRLFMDGRAIVEFMLTRVPGSVENCLKKNELDSDRIDFFVFHQASGYMVKQLIRAMKLPPEKVPIRVEQVGNTVSSSIPLALADMADGGLITGKTLLVCGFGVGLSWATNVLFY